MKRVEVGIALPAEQRVPEVAGLGGEEVELRIAPSQQAREQVEREREAIQLREERHHERGERSERAPVRPAAGPHETEGKENEDGGVDRHERPQTVCGLLAHGPRSP